VRCVHTTSLGVTAICASRSVSTMFANSSAAIGVRERAHFTLHVLNLSPATRVWVDRIHHLLIAGFGALAAWYGIKLCLLNRTLTTPGLEINLAVLYASAVVGGLLLVVYAISMIVAPPPRDHAIVPLEVRAE